MKECIGRVTKYLPKAIHHQPTNQPTLHMHLQIMHTVQLQGKLRRDG